MYIYRVRRKKKELARFVGQGGTKGGEKEEEKAAKGRASSPSTGRCHLDCVHTSLFHNQRKFALHRQISREDILIPIKLFNRNNFKGNRNTFKNLLNKKLSVLYCI